MKHFSSGVSFGLVAVVLLGLTASCGHTPPVDFHPMTARFFLEAQDDRAPVMVLPRSGVSIAIEAKPVVSEFDFITVEVARVELGECLLFQLDGAAARDLYRMTTVHQGRRLVLLVNGAPMGARRIEQPWDDGRILVFVEVADQALPALAADIRRTATEVRRKAQKG